MNRIFIYFLVCLCSCKTYQSINLPERKASAITGSQFYEQQVAAKWEAREKVIVNELLAGNMPSFLQKFTAVHVEATDSSGKKNKLTFFVSKDYLSIGSNDDWARVPITPMSAQMIADSVHCFLPTRKMVDDIYRYSKVKLAPVPMYAFRDSAITFWQHHLIIEGQRKGRKGLIAGIKKDVVISGKITRDTKGNRVAIYGWHLLSGKAIQPLYTGHVNWYVDYSHGIRLVYRKMKVNGKWMDYIDVLKDPALRALICDEEFCDVYRY